MPSDIPRWLDADAASNYLSLRIDAFMRAVNAGRIPRSSAHPRSGAPCWDANVIDGMMLSGFRKNRRRRNSDPKDLTLLTEQEIILSSRRVPRSGSGIYFLIKHGVIVYIGQSADVLGRICSHKKRKFFTRWHWIPCPLRSLNKTESAYIRYLRPTLNKTHNFTPNA